MATGGQHTGLKQLLAKLPNDKPTLVWLADIELFCGLYCHVVEGFLASVKAMPQCIAAMTTRYSDRVATSLRSLADDHINLVASGNKTERMRLCRWFLRGEIDDGSIIEDAAMRTQGKSAAETFAVLADTVNRHKGGMEVEKDNAQLGVVRWEDIGGLDDIIDELKESIVWPILRRDQFRKLGIRPPRGVLLYGPPGTGKTMLAKAAATEVLANFIPIAIPDLIKGEVGESEKALAAVFETAKRGPSIVFLDEIEAIFGSRDQAGEVGKKLISQLFLEMDNIPDDAHLVVLAATNAPHLMDESILRPGRLDKKIHVPRPGYASRRDILGRTTKHLDIDNREELIATLAELEMSGAEIKALVRAACYSAIQRGSKVLTESDFDSAVEATHFQNEFS
ncbi:hypothetical protein GGI15_001203 [Coemansia interrupta]|uniref:AAA+ ATPase domain-containing protein n=1 Tax=Coemansia interrupta TaxID=1126814 RepID=A0A9W8LP43_9FUNG|nr:hypothetical protein GGI15_001203 [Coemansia interrupta]